MENKKFIWQKHYSVGVEVIDEQHKYLFELGNQLVEATLKDAKYYIEELNNYAKTHFKFEEKHMKLIGYPELSSHIEKHNELCAELRTYSNNLFRDEEDFQIFKEFLYFWIINHIMKEDAKYFNFSNKEK